MYGSGAIRTCGKREAVRGGHQCTDSWCEPSPCPEARLPPPDSLISKLQPLVLPFTSCGTWDKHSISPWFSVFIGKMGIKMSTTLVCCCYQCISICQGLSMSYCIPQTTVTACDMTIFEILDSCHTYMVSTKRL
jgi:hypothetical protein